MTPEARACCYVSKDVAEWKDNKCQCKESSTEFDAQTHECKKKECASGFVRIMGSNSDECILRDYLFSDICTCRDGTNNCKLEKDAAGNKICQSAKGWGFKCSCQDCPNGMHYSSILSGCVNDCIAGQQEYGGTCLDKAEFDQLKTDGTYGLYCIRNYNVNPGGYLDSTPCAKICNELGGQVVNITNGSMMHAAYSGCDCSSGGNTKCNKVFKGRLPQLFNWH